MALQEVTIKDVPEEAVDAVKNLAAVAVERHYTRTDLVLAESKQKAFETKVDSFRDKNGMEKKFTKEVVE